jgi:zinc transport system substrate-binding protein
MKKRLYKTIIILLIIVCYAIPTLAAKQVRVFVSIAPQKYFVQQIGKDRVAVEIMVPAGANPHTYEPRPRQMVALSKTHLYFAIGVPFEKTWLPKIAAASPNLKIVPTDHGIKKLHMAAHHDHEDEHAHHADDHVKEHADDEHPDEREHAEAAGRDPHIWLSPSLVKIQARTIRDALQASDPAHRADYAASYDNFAARIDRLDSNLRKIFAGREGLRFMVFHPSWGYFAKTYNLKQVPIEIEGKNPKPAQLKELIEHARENGIKVVFVQPQFATRSAQLIAREIGGQVAYADPLAEDWMANLHEVAEKFKTAFAQ